LIKLSLSEVAIETTRRCNARCPHCLRGESEEKDINLKYVDRLFSQLDLIGTLLIGGGEPSQAPEMIDAVVEIARRHKLEIQNFYLVTNALEVTPQFMQSVINLYAYCSDNEVSRLDISTDGFHPEAPKKSYDMLDVFKFTGRKRDFGEDMLLQEGRAQNNYPVVVDPRLPERMLFRVDENNVAEDLIYLTCDGRLYSSCDLSYETMKTNSFFIGAVTEDFNLKQMIDKYLEQYPDD
jgi:organic radical activating enzyme